MLTLAQRAAQFRQRDVLQLTDALAGDAEFFTDLFERPAVSAVQPKAGHDNFAFPVIENPEKVRDFFL